MSMMMPLVTIALLLAVPLAAQRGGGGGGGDFGGGAPPTAPKTPFQIIVDELKLDRKTQVPAVTELFSAAEAESFAIVEEMLNLRQRMLNVETGGTPDPKGEIPTAYAEAVEKMVALEAKLFSQTYALLTPDQRPRSPKAFALMAGFFRALPPSGGAPAGGRFGGRGGGR
jgi:hypothetical protein